MGSNKSAVHPMKGQLGHHTIMKLSGGNSATVNIIQKLKWGGGGITKIDRSISNSLDFSTLYKSENSQKLAAIWNIFMLL